jgi:hypothetical protein
LPSFQNCGYVSRVARTEAVEWGKLALETKKREKGGRMGVGGERKLKRYVVWS